MGQLPLGFLLRAGGVVQVLTGGRPAVFVQRQAQEDNADDDSPKRYEHESIIDGWIRAWL